MGMYGIHPASDEGPADVTSLDRFLDAMAERGIVSGTQAHSNRLVGWQACEEAMAEQMAEMDAELTRWKQRYADLYGAVLKLHAAFDNVYDVDDGHPNVDSDIAQGIERAYRIAKNWSAK